MKKPWWYWILLAVLVALMGNMILELGWMAPWDPSGKLTLLACIGVLWVIGQRQQAERERQAPDPAKTELTMEWSDPATRRNKWRIAAFCLVVVLFIWGAQWFSARGRTEPWIMLTTGAILVAILTGVLYRNHFRVVDTVTQTGTGLRLQRGSTVDQVLFSDLAAIDEGGGGAWESGLRAVTGLSGDIMGNPRALFVVAALLYATGGVAVASDADKASLVVTGEGDSIVLTVPASKVKVILPRGNLKRDEEPGSGATASPRYFKFSDSDKGLIISGWFESEASWEGWKKFLPAEWSALFKSEAPPTKVPDSLSEGPWNGFAYDVNFKGAKSAHLRAEAFKSGTWVDLHISVTSDAPLAEAHTQALALLKSVEVKKK